MAFFNNTRDEDTVEDYPLLRHFSPADSLQLVELRQWIEKQAGTQRADEVFQFVKFHNEKSEFGQRVCAELLVQKITIVKKIRLRDHILR
jgi:hypothetical protein